MGLTASNTGGGDFVLPDENTYVAICCHVIDMGTIYDKTWKKWGPKVLLGWELCNTVNPHPDFDGKPFVVQNRYTVSLGLKSNLRPMLVAWRGKEFTPEEEEGFQLRKVLGAPCMLSIVHSEDKQYANVKGVMAMPAGSPKPTLVNNTILFDLDKPDEEVFSNFSEKFQKTINGSKERNPNWAATDPLAAPAVDAPLPADSGQHETISEDDIPFDSSPNL